MKTTYWKVAPNSSPSEYVSSSSRVTKRRSRQIGAAAFPIQMASGVKLKSIQAFRASSVARSVFESPPPRVVPALSHSSICLT